MYKDTTVGHPVPDHRDVEQICLSWHLIRGADPNYKENMIRVLDKRYVLESEACHDC